MKYQLLITAAIISAISMIPALSAVYFPSWMRLLGWLRFLFPCCYSWIYRKNNPHLPILALLLLALLAILQLAPGRHPAVWWSFVLVHAALWSCIIFLCVKKSQMIIACFCFMHAASVLILQINVLRFLPRTVIDILFTTNHVCYVVALVLFAAEFFQKSKTAATYVSSNLQNEETENIAVANQPQSSAIGIYALIFSTMGYLIAITNTPDVIFASLAFVFSIAAIVKKQYGLGISALIIVLVAQSISPLIIQLIIQLIIHIMMLMP